MSSPYIVFGLDLSRFANIDPSIAALEGELEEVSEGAHNSRMAEILPLLDRIPAMEADMFRMYYIDGKPQTDISDIFGISQAGVSYRLARATRRIKFLVSLPSLSDDDVTAALRSTPLNTVEIAILLKYRETTQQTRTAVETGLSQSKVRHSLVTSTERLTQWAVERPELEEVARMFRKRCMSPI